MIKTIIFDNIGVFTPSYYDYSVHLIAEFLEIDSDKLIPVWDKEAEKLDIGDIDYHTFHKNIMKKFGVSKNTADFRKIHFGSFKQNQNMRKLALKLKENYEIVMLTNYGDDFDECNESWKLEEIFGEKIFISCDLKMIKPDKKIFLHTLEQLKRKPEETLLIDDSKKNIDVARELGMNVILFKNFRKLKQDLAKYIKM